ncbi:uncharacterized protein B0P05DRAFT_530895 [Gilbertella persicaria]|uniref:uncharacterized protein n=1 Tax=Gilbertella persicaria TaxID=101096 RepID=UPI00221F675E|nr:uncharacterized protein B0P05DRAFT_530895 [Gilbertella persicaria]KAI8087961.1 hypothetical protein B0P05DRAFT_530895 [Gilbertella persicaria]
MFHSSSSRHEQYIVRTKATLHKKRSSLESENSGADSGYTSSSSTPSTNTNHVVTESDNLNKTSSITDTVTSSTSTIVTTPKKKKPKKHQSPRQPDLVYSCPRPLAFPFHNDDHFLPIAEADPRDVARVSPSLNRSSSLQSSSKTSVGSTRMYDNSQYSASSHRSAKSLDGVSAYSQQSSILSTIQRGTVRSIRSLFQLPDSLSNSLSRVQSNQTAYSSQSLQRLEIKKGTVQSIKDMFSLKRSNLQKPLAQSRQLPQGKVGATIGQFESSATLAKSNESMMTTPLKQKQGSHVTLVSSSSPSLVKQEPKPKTSFTSRATKFASRALWKSAPKTPQEAPSVTKSSSAKPLPKTPTEARTEPTKKTTLKSEVKKISARMFALPKTWTKKPSVIPQPPPTSASPPPPIDKTPKIPKKSLFSSFKKSYPSTEVDKNKKATAATTTTTTEADEVPPTTTTVGKMWKSFKNLVTGKKSSRVGVL